ncbi:MAG: transcription termination/antitermination NusG family protein [Chitinophagaceae bacterium]
MQMICDPTWYIVYTKRLLEKKVMQQLTKRKIDHYCPMARMKKHENNRIILNHKPLFPSYVFVQGNDNQINSLSRISSILSIVHRFKEPAIISNEEIKGIRNFVERYDNVLLEKTQLFVNHFSDTTQAGPVQQEEGNYFINLHLPSLGYILKANIGLESVKPADVLFLNGEYQAFTSKVAN